MAKKKKKNKQEQKNLGYFQFTKDEFYGTSRRNRRSKGKKNKQGKQNHVSKSTDVLLDGEILEIITEFDKDSPST